MTNLHTIAFCDARGVIGFAASCPNHSLGFASGPETLVKPIVEAAATRRHSDNALIIPEFNDRQIDALINFGAHIRDEIAKTLENRDNSAAQFDLTRKTAAEEAFENFDFGTTVAETDNWQNDTSSNRYSIVVYLNSKIAGKDTTPATFNVTFHQKTTTIDEVYANIDGRILYRPSA